MKPYQDLSNKRANLRVDGSNSAGHIVHRYIGSTYILLVAIVCPCSGAEWPRRISWVFAALRPLLRP